MMSYKPEETLNLQIQHKRQTLSYWLEKDNSRYKPLEGELIIVTDPPQHVKYVLVGDGQSSVGALMLNNAIQLGSISRETITGLFSQTNTESK